MNIEVGVKDSLSKREAQVLSLLVKGVSNIKIAESLFITETTVKFHCKNIYKKLRVKSKLELLVFLQSNNGLSRELNQVNGKSVSVCE